MENANVLIIGRRGADGSRSRGVGDGVGGLVVSLVVWGVACVVISVSVLARHLATGSTTWVGQNHQK